MHLNAKGNIALTIEFESNQVLLNSEWSAIYPLEKKAEQTDLLQHTNKEGFRPTKGDTSILFRQGTMERTNRSRYKSPNYNS